MQRLFLGIAICASAGISLLVAQARSPVIGFDSVNVDAGRVAEGEKITHTFKVTNKGEAALEILGVEPSCGCTSTKWSKKISPGGSGQIEAEITTDGMTALSRTFDETMRISKTITVKSNDLSQPQVVLTVTATVAPEIVLSEPEIFFGVVPPGQEVSKDLLVEISPERTIRLLGVTCGGDFTARLEPLPGSEDKKIRVIAVLEPMSVEGMHQGTIVIKTTSRLKPELKIPVRGIIKKSGNGKACHM